MNVFVYGTLKEGFGNFGTMKGAEGEFMGYAWTEDRFDLFSFGGFPGMIEGGERKVLGELFRVRNIEPLDRLEGHPSFYTRKEIPVQVEDAKGENRVKHTAWAYMIPDSTRYGDLSPHLERSQLLNSVRWV